MASTMKTGVAFVVMFLLLACAVLAENQAADEGDNAKKASETEEVPKVDDKQLEYAKGSLCQYCGYCKFCSYCDKDCPCEASRSKPNCHMCKYCKFCHLCKACDTICQPGGVIDRWTSAIVNALPTYNEEEVNKDLDSVKDWIAKDKKKDEL